MESKGTEVGTYEVTAKRQLTTVRLHPFTLELIKAFMDVTGKDKTSIIEEAIWLAFNKSKLNPFIKEDIDSEKLLENFSSRTEILSQTIGLRFLKANGFPDMPWEKKKKKKERGK
jgi:hypothetical protein